MKEIKKQKYRVDQIFRPGKKVDVVFARNSLVPIVRSSLIHECDYDHSRMVISQTTPYILPSFKNKQMEITTMVFEELGKKFRAGLTSGIIEFIKDYEISETARQDCILLGYSQKIHRLNIRTAYRFEPNAGFMVSGTIVVDGKTFQSGQNFKVHDISFAGIGILIPKNQIKEDRNLLFQMKTGETVLVSLALIDKNMQKTVARINTEMQIIRKNNSYNKKSGFIGAKFIGISPNKQETLNKFIHEAQLYQIRNTAVI